MSTDGQQGGQRTRRGLAAALNLRRNRVNAGGQGGQLPPLPPSPQQPPPPSPTPPQQQQQQRAWVAAPNKGNDQAPRQPGVVLGDGQDNAKAKVRFENLLKQQAGTLVQAKQLHLAIDGKRLAAERQTPPNQQLAQGLGQLAQVLGAAVKKIDEHGSSVRQAVQDRNYIVAEEQFNKGLELARKVIAKENELTEIEKQFGVAVQPRQSDEEGWQAFRRSLAESRDSIEQARSLIKSDNFSVSRAAQQLQATYQESLDAEEEGQLAPAVDSLSQSVELAGRALAMQTAWQKFGQQRRAVEPLVRQLQRAKVSDEQSPKRDGALKRYLSANKLAQAGEFEQAGDLLLQVTAQASELLPDEGQAARTYVWTWDDSEPALRKALTLPGDCDRLKRRQKALSQALVDIPKLAEEADYEKAQEQLRDAMELVRDAQNVSLGWSHYEGEWAAVASTVKTAAKVASDDSKVKSLQAELTKAREEADRKAHAGDFDGASTSIDAAVGIARKILDASYGPTAVEHFREKDGLGKLFDEAERVDAKCLVVVNAKRELEKRRKLVDDSERDGQFKPQAEYELGLAATGAWAVLNSNERYQSYTRMEATYGSVIAAAKKVDARLPGVVVLQNQMDQSLVAAAQGIDTDLDAAIAAMRNAARMAQKIVAIQENQQKQVDRKRALDEVMGGVQKSYLPAGMADSLAGQSRSGVDPLWDQFLVAMKAAENGKSDQDLDALAKAATDWLKAFAKMAPEQQTTPAIVKRRDNCEAALKQARHLKLANQAQALGSPPWSPEQEDAAADLYVQTLFETGEEPMLRAGDSMFGAKWIMSRDFEKDQAQRNFIYKAANVVDGDVPNPEILGFAPGCEAVREVMGDELNRQLKSMTGLEFRVPETRIVGVRGDRLGPDAGSKVYVGSAQAAAPNIGKVDEVYWESPDLMRKISPEATQKAAIFDAIALNVDRNRNNFLVSPPDENGRHELVPIDNGLAFPTREGLDGRRGRIADQTAFKDIPAAYEPFSPEMLAAIDMIDADEVVASLKSRTQSLGNQHGDLNVQGIPVESIDMLRRNIKFLKAAAPKVSPAVLMDLVMENASEIFDTPDDGVDEAFRKVIAKGRERDAALGPFVDMSEPEKSAMFLEIWKLGWAPALDEPGGTMGSGNAQWHLWCRRNPRQAFKIARERKKCPQAEKQLAKVVDAIKRVDANANLARIDNAESIMEALAAAKELSEKLAHDAELLQLTNDYRAMFPKDVLPEKVLDRKEVLERFRLFTKNGGKQLAEFNGRKLEKLGFEERWRLLKKEVGPDREKERIAAINQTPPCQEMRREFARFDLTLGKLNSPELLVKALKAWERLKALGGIKAYLDCGGDIERAAGNGPIDMLEWVESVKFVQGLEVDA